MAVSGSGVKSGHCGRQQEQEALGGHTHGTRVAQGRTPYMDLHTGDMPHACSHHAIRVQATAWPSEGKQTVGGGRHVAFVLLFSLHMLGSLGNPWTLVRLILSPGVTVTPTAAGDGGGVCAGKEAIVSNYPTRDLETEARAEPAAAPSRPENSLR